MSILPVGTTAVSMQARNILSEDLCVSERKHSESGGINLFDGSCGAGTAHVAQVRLMWHRYGSCGIGTIEQL